MQRSGTISTWNRNPADEEAMGAAHAPIWRRMIDVSVTDDLRGATVLDYGCNQGGFLRMLYDRHPFRAGVGLDIARESVARAELLKRQRPIDYRAGSIAADLGHTFDLAFSHEVLYLLPDLAVHAADMKDALRPGGALYIVDFKLAEGAAPPPDKRHVRFGEAGMRAEVESFGFKSAEEIAIDGLSENYMLKFIRP